jgi:hypothetical protein
MEGESLVDTAEASNEMIFEGADGAFGSIATMNIWWGKLEVNVLGGEEIFQCLGSLVVKSL